MADVNPALCASALAVVVCLGSLATSSAQPAHARLWLQRFAPPMTADYTGPVVEAGGSFKTVVASWNVRTPHDSWIEIGLRARVGQHWTRWYDMGHWSADLSSGFRHSVAKQVDDDGWVDTDTLMLSHAAQALQARVRFHTGVSAERPQLSLLAVTTDAPDAEASGAAAWGEDIDVPQHTQHIDESAHNMGGGGEAWCSPTSVSMVASYWAQQLHHPEWDFDVASSAAGTFDPVYDGCGNWPFNVAYVSEHALAGWVERLNGLHDVERYIARGVPVIASIKVERGEMAGTPYETTDGHLLVIRGFTAQGDVIVNDPAGRPGAIRRVYDRTQFTHSWLNGSQGIVYVIGPPAVLRDLR